MERRVAVIVEDDEDIRRLMAEVLGQSGFDVHEAGTGIAGVAAVREHEPAVITVDLGLPDIDGYEVTRQVRRFTDAYVVILTARTEEIDTLLGLEAGADDYITKPFRPRELRARIEAMLRRPRTGVPTSEGANPSTPVPSGLAAPSAPLVTSVPRPLASPPPAVHLGAVPEPPSGSRSEAATVLEDPAARTRLELDGLALYPHLHHVEADGVQVPLTPTEFIVLETLLRSGRVVRSKAELARVMHGEDADGGTFVSRSDERAVEVHLGNLRRKLADDPQEPRWIQTVRGIGYRVAGRPVTIS